MINQLRRAYLLNSDMIISEYELILEASPLVFSRDIFSMFFFQGFQKDQYQ
jgi:hypothetical protein